MASAGLLVLGALEVSLFPLAAKVALAAVFFLGISRLSLRLGRFLVPDEDRATTLTAALVVLVASWMLIATTLGHFGLLTSRVVLIVVALALLVAAPFRSATAVPRKRTTPEIDRLERWAILGTLAFFWVALLVAVISERNAPPGAHGYDDTSYHLSAVATWFQWHDLRSIKFPVGDGSTAFYPIGGELFSLLLLLPLDGIDFLARWSEAPFALGALVALASLARLLSLRTGAAAVAVLLYAASPRVFPSGMLGAGNDHALAFCTLASACAALLLRRGPTVGRAVFLGAALGLMIGTKYTGAMFLPPLLLLAGACLASGLWSSPPEDRRAAVWPVSLGFLVGVATMFGVGGYTYLRNAVGSGNPLFPATLSIGGHRIFQGWADDTIAGLAIRGRSGLEPLRFLWDRIDLLGPLFRWILLPGAVLAPAMAFLSWTVSRLRPTRAQGTSRVEAGEIILLSLPAIFYLTFVRLMADHRDIRYVFGGLALTGLAVAWLLERLPPGAARFGRLTVALVVLATLVASQRTKGGLGRVLAVGAVSAVIVMGYAFWRQVPRRKLTLARGSLAAGAVFLALGSVGTGRLFERYLSRKLETNPAASFLDRTASPGTTIAFCGGNQPFLFFGRQLQNRVLYVPTYLGPGERGLSPPLGASFFSWKGSLEFPRHRVDRKEWRENLRLLAVAFVAVERTGDELPERDWIAIEPEGFPRVFGDSRMEVFAVREDSTREDTLRVSFDRPESEYFLLNSSRREKRDGDGRAALLVPLDGADLIVPPLDAPATSLTLEEEALESPRRNLRVSVNGHPAGEIAREAGPLRFRIEDSIWRAGRNRISIAPAEPGQSGATRIAALEITLDTSRPTARRGSGELPGYLEVPAEGSSIRGNVLTAVGWCRERGGGRIDPVRFAIDGLDANPVRLNRPDRPDVVSALPYVVVPKETGFAVDLDVSRLSMGDHTLVVELETPDGRRRTLAPRRFHLMK